MTRRIRHAPADCDVGDFFPCPVESGVNLVWYCMDPSGSVITTFDDPTFSVPVRWLFHRAAWRSDSGPYVIDVFVRRS
jgi:hypothetical protein